MASEQDLNKLVFVLRRAAGISAEMAEIIAGLFKELNIVIDLDGTIAENRKKINKILNSAEIDSEFKSKMLAISSVVIAIHPKLKAIKPTDALVNAALSNIMPDVNLSTNDLIDRTIGLTRSSVVNFVHQAYQNGWTRKQLSQALKTTEAQAARHLSTIARTGVNAVSNETKKRLYKANSDLIDRVLFSATLDSRTSNICKTLDGKAFTLDDAPSLPLHPNERSQLLPILIGEDIDQVKKDLLPRPAVEPKNKEKYEDQGLKTRTGKTRKPSKTDKSPLKGTQSRSDNYESWLKKQPAYYQDDIIGKAAGKRFREGDDLVKLIDVSPITEEYLNKAIN